MAALDTAARATVVEARNRLARTELALASAEAELARIHHRLAILEGAAGFAVQRGEDDRVQEARRLRGLGLSVRAIAVEINASRASVQRWIDGTPAPAEILGVDGRRRRNGFSPGRRVA